jgi:triosephosphate isomerase
MARRPIIAGNWKMNLNHLEAIAVVQKLAYTLDGRELEQNEVVVVPPFTCLRSIQTLLQSDRIDMALGAQNCHWEDSGAFTGEISPTMLAKLDVTYVICGHSERRHVFGESDEVVNRKVRAVLGHGMIPILCVGETLEERDGGRTDEVVRRQVDAGSIPTLVVAYEPVWAIGTGRNAEPQDAAAVIGMIRRTVRDRFGGGADDMRIQYGGSVKSGNIGGFMEQPEIDGALVGGASLDAEEFARIVRFK